MYTSSYGPSRLRAPAVLACLLATSAALAACKSSDTPVGPPARADAAASSIEGVTTTPSVLAAKTVVATGLNNPRGLRFGPDGALYVAEAGSGGTTSTAGQCTQVVPPVGPYTGGNDAQITRIGPDGVKSAVATGLPSAINAMGFVSGVSDLEFIDGSAYLLIDGGGCSHGHSDVPNGIMRIDRDGSRRIVANLSAFYQSHPTAKPEPDDFEPDGTPYSMVAVAGNLFVVEPNHGSLDRVEPNGDINRVLDVSAYYGHIVPTSVTFHGAFFIGNLGTFPVVPGSSRIIATIGFGVQRTLITGLSTVLGSAWDRQGRYYVLQSSTAAGEPTPMTGRVSRIDPSGEIVTIADGLFFPTAMTLGPDGNLYVSNVGFGPPPSGLGTIVQIKIN